MTNPGYTPSEINKLRQQLSGKSFQLLEADEANEEFRHFYFIGRHEGEEVIYDTVVYTLRLQHESEMLERAEERALEKFPAYRKIREEQPDEEELTIPSELEEEIGMFIAEAILEMEEEGDIKVSEHAETDPEADFGVGLDVGLNVAKLTDTIIEKFIRDFNNNSLALDETLVTFERGDDDESLRFKE